MREGDDLVTVTVQRKNPEPRCALAALRAQRRAVVQVRANKRTAEWAKLAFESGTIEVNIS